MAAVLDAERSDEALEVHERMLAACPARSRHIEGGSDRRVHVIEAGAGPPVLMLHGSNTSSLSLLPLLEHLQGVRAVAIDRPGFGLSDAVHVPRERFRDAACEFIDRVADELGLEMFALAGNSMGGTWALWYGLARPERVRALALLGSAPLLPGTRVPMPLRVSAAPVVGDLLKRVVKPNAKMVVRLMSSMGEKDTIVRYPDLVDAVVAAGKDPTASAVNLAELRAAISSFGFRRSMRVHPHELRRLTVSTLLIWGDHDPVGAAGVAERTARLIPTAQLEIPYGGTFSGADAVIGWFTRDLWRWFDEFTSTPEGLIDAGEQIVVPVHVRARARNGKTMDVHNVWIYEFDAGMLTRGRVYADTAVLRDTVEGITPA